MISTVQLGYISLFLNFGKMNSNEFKHKGVSSSNYLHNRVEHINKSNMSKKWNKLTIKLALRVILLIYLNY